MEKKKIKSKKEGFSDSVQMEGTSSNSSQFSNAELAWKLIAMLREETLSTQRIRAQVIGVKITTISLGIGFILDKGASPVVYIIIAYAAILFDFLISSYSIAIKRIGLYIRTELEQKIIRKETNWPHDALLWEEFMMRQVSTQWFSTYGNLGLTSLAFLLAVASLFMPIDPWGNKLPGMVIISYLMVLGLLPLLYLDVRAHLQPRKLFFTGS